MGPPEMLEADYNETVRDVLSKALEIFRISVSNNNIAVCMLSLVILWKGVVYTYVF